MFNPDKLLFKQAISGQMFSPTDGVLFWTLEDLKDVNIQTNATSQDKTDATGAVIAKYYDADTAQITGNTSFLTLSLLAAQWGTEKNVASSTNKILIPKREKIKVGSDITKITLSKVPVGGISFIYLLNERKEQVASYKYAAVNSEKEFSLDAAKKEITLPTDTAIKEGMTIQVYYTYESENAVDITKSTNDMPKSGEFWLESIFTDICDKNIEYHGWVVMASAQLSPETQIPLNKTGDFSFTIDSLKDYCSDEGQLLRFVIPED